MNENLQILLICLAAGLLLWRFGVALRFLFQSEKLWGSLVWVGYGLIYVIVPFDFDFVVCYVDDFIVMVIVLIYFLGVFFEELFSRGWQAFKIAFWIEKMPESE